MNSLFELGYGVQDWTSSSSLRRTYSRSMAQEHAHGADPHDRVFKDLEVKMRDADAQFDSYLDKLREVFVFGNDKEVEQFIRNQRVVATFLAEAAPYLRDAFGSSQPIVLQLMLGEERHLLICALVMWIGSAADARAALRNFDQTWLNLNARKISGRILFDYELV
jgi:hypothetical protein